MRGASESRGAAYDSCRGGLACDAMCAGSCAGLCWAGLAVQKKHRNSYLQSRTHALVVRVRLDPCFPADSYSIPRNSFHLYTHAHQAVSILGQRLGLCRGAAGSALTVSIPCRCCIPPRSLLLRESAGGVSGRWQGRVCLLASRRSTMAPAAIETPGLC